jgi:hypothetical protein
MTILRLYRISGLGLAIGAALFIVHVIARSMVTAGLEPSASAMQSLWIPINALGVVGAMLVSLGLPALYARVAASSGRMGLIGMVLIAVAWMFFGVFLSFYGALVMPWLAEKAPTLVAKSAAVPTAFVVAFILGLLAWILGTVLFAIPFIRGHIRPGWVGYALPASTLWTLIGDLVIAPSGPVSNFAINLLSNLGPVIFLIAVGYLGWQMRSGSANELSTEPGNVA